MGASSPDRVRDTVDQPPASGGPRALDGDAVELFAASWSGLLAARLCSSSAEPRGLPGPTTLEG
ncbi:MAG: hypothetical protein BGO96_11820 [Micrococcales bacterium 73-15]|nr:MAG: hypothetical protein BGO96_11820 [Micrococcales bacterium 73-15]